MHTICQSHRHFRQSYQCRQITTIRVVKRHRYFIVCLFVCIFAVRSYMCEFVTFNSLIAKVGRKSVEEAWRVRHLEWMLFISLCTPHCLVKIQLKKIIFIQNCNSKQQHWLWKFSIPNFFFSILLFCFIFDCHNLDH